MESSLVLDNGGFYCRIGKSGEDYHGFKCRSIVSLDDHLIVGDDAVIDDRFVSPMERGIVLDWERMELVWKHAYKSMQYNPGDCAVLCTESILNPKRNREKMIEVLFESMQVPYAQVASDGLLNVYAQGRGTALSVMCGDGSCSVFPICEGYIMTSGLTRSNFGGSDVTLYLMKLLKESGKLNFNMAIANCIKEKLCDCKGTGNEKIYNLPDGSTVSIGEEAVKAANLMFDPSPICDKEPSIPDLIVSSVQNLEIDLRFFVGHTILGGGHSLMSQFADRLREVLKERLALICPGLNSRVVAPTDADSTVWVGGSILSSLSSFQNRWISHRDYADFGPSIAHRKQCGS